MLNILRSFLKICDLFQDFKNLYPPINIKNKRTLEKNRRKKVLVLGKKIRLWYQYQNWTLISVPDTETWFWSHTTSPCWIYTSFSKTLYLACADDDSRRKSDLIPFVYTATTTIYSNTTPKLCPSAVFLLHHPTVNPIFCYVSFQPITSQLSSLISKVFFVTEVFHSWTLADSIHISEGHSNTFLLCVRKLPGCAVRRYFLNRS